MLPAFPAFINLTLNHRDQYNDLVRKYPSFSDISFPTLHIWWNQSEKLAVSSLNDNLVINYHLEFDENNSGYSLIGRHLIDDSIQTVFKHFRQHHLPVQLVHVPEFVVDKIARRENLEIEEEPDYHEYIMNSRALASLESSDFSRIRRKVNRFLREVEYKEIETKSLNLAAKETQKSIFDSVQDWQKKHPAHNDPSRTEDKAIKATLQNSSVLRIQNLCLLINGQLHAMVLYHRSLDGKYFIIHHLKVDYSTPFIYDFITNQIAKKAVEQAVPFINMEMDLGIEGLKAHKTGLRPVYFLKKYKISPK
jgi:hypothetical protein